jgi:hypothetical protein
MTNSIAHYHFIPSVRFGLAAAIPNSNPVFPHAIVTASLNAIAYKTDGTVEDPCPIPKKIGLYGPGDIVGFDKCMIVRKSPEAGVGDFEDNHFPFAEFAEADYPWRFTPAAATNTGDGVQNPSSKLIPWIALIVLREGGPGETSEFTEEKRQNDKSLPWITVNASCLPNLSYAYRWAHVQLSMDSDESPPEGYEEFIRTNPRRVVSRLICPRRLLPTTKYRSFVVPTFEPGRLAGLGQSIESSTKTFAWSSDDQEIQLPYYYSWEFGTGGSGDFEYLVRLLKPRKLEDLGLRDIDCSDPGYLIHGSDNDTALVLGLEGSLRSLDTEYSSWGKDAKAVIHFEQLTAHPFTIFEGLLQAEATHANITWKTDVEATSRIDYGETAAYGQSQSTATPTKDHVLPLAGLAPSKTYHFQITSVGKDGSTVSTADGTFQTPPQAEAFQADLADLLNEPNPDSGSVTCDTPRLVPPIYGRWHAPRNRVEEDCVTDIWVDVLNLDPRHRIAAGLGTKVIQEQQEALVASAWDQLGTIDKANEIIRRGRLGREASSRIYQRLNCLPSPGEFLRVVSPVAQRIRVPVEPGSPTPAATVMKTLADSPIPVASLDPSFRRIARPRGPLRRRQPQPVDPKTGAPIVNIDDLLIRLNNGTLRAAGPAPTPRGTMGVCDVTQYHWPPRFTSLPPSGPSRGEFRYEIKATGHDGTESLSITALSLPGWLTLTNQGNGKALLFGNPSVSGNVSFGVKLVVTDITDSSSTPQKQACQNFGISCSGPYRTSASTGSTNVQWEVTSIFSQVPFCDKFITGSLVQDALSDQSTLGELNLPAGLSPDIIQSIVPGILDNWLNYIPESPNPPTAITLEKITDILRDALNPQTTIAARIAKRLKLAEGVQQQDALESLIGALEFPQPMYEPLRDLSQDYILPGIDRIPQNTLGLLTTNRRFVEAYMCGLNHEFSAELRWRECPVDPKATYFRQFWDVGGSTEESRKDIKPIPLWRDNPLGNNPPDVIDSNQVKDNLVLVIRGELLRKYPNTVIYAVEAKTITEEDGSTRVVPDLDEYTHNGNAASLKFPVFSGKLRPDTTFLGFDFDKTWAQGDGNEHLGAFFILEERVSEARFGMDKALQIPKDNLIDKLLSWDDLSWDFLDSEVKCGRYIDSTPSTGLVISQNGTETLITHWNLSSTSSDIAYILLRSPFRLAVHAKQLICDS